MIDKETLIDEIKLRLAQSCRLQPRCNCSYMLEMLNFYLNETQKELTSGSEQS